jgi:hypothetical protein
MGDVINLRRARKANAREEKVQKAERNRCLFGRPNGEKQRDAALRDKSRCFVEGHRRERGDEERQR